MCEGLQLICFEANLVLENDVVCGSSSTFQTLMGLQPKFADDSTANVTINDGAGLGIPGTLAFRGVIVGIIQGGRVEAGVVALANHYDRHLRPLPLVAIEFGECCLE